jgi:hypothetical protein
VRNTDTTNRLRLGPSEDSVHAAVASPTEAANTGPMTSTTASTGTWRSVARLDSSATVAGREPVPNAESPSVPARLAHQMYVWASDQPGTRIPLTGNKMT